MNKSSSLSFLQEETDIFVKKIDTKITECSKLRSSFDDKSPKSIVLEQYQICVTFLSEFFGYTKNHFWEEDGIGSCGIGESHSEAGIDGPFAGEILKLRGEKRPKIINTHGACTFHKQQVGCILGGLKSPLCVTHVDSDVPNTYNELKFRELLHTIQLAGGTMEKMYTDIDPQKNRSIVVEFLEEVKKNILEVKKSI